ncbi:MAG TPA: cupredoxin family copper-binding protein [Rhizomicrobium sp.]|nr:cupredoxin family copper-binding protein [Rhizomicrobium sp.]
MKSGIFALALLSFSLFARPTLAADAIIVMKNFHFSPTNVSVPVGATVTWKNMDGEPHTVASADGLFRSSALDENDTYKFKFDHAGVFKYICSIHPNMRATITVK